VWDNETPKKGCKKASMKQERFLVDFSTRLNTALGTDETGIWDGQFHTGLAYRQWTSKRKSRILLPIMAFIEDGKDYDGMGLCVYVASDGTHFGQKNIEFYIDGKPNPNPKKHINPKYLFMTAI
jgi:hypothetical protein